MPVPTRSQKRDISGKHRDITSRRHTVADSSTLFAEKTLSRIREESKIIPKTPEANPSGPPKMTGSEKKKILLDIVKEQLVKHGMNRTHDKYKDCIRKLHEMCRTLVKVNFMKLEIFRLKKVIRLIHSPFNNRTFFLNLLVI